MSLTVNTPASGQSRGRIDAPRPQYIELKANVHRKLLNRLNLEALATADRPRAESEIRTLLFDLINEEGMPLSLSERESILSDVDRKSTRLNSSHLVISYAVFCSTT